MKRKYGFRFALVFACATIVAAFMLALPVQAAQYAGNYKGFYHGVEDYGVFVLTFDAGGNISGTATSGKTGAEVPLSGSCQSGGGFQFKSAGMVFNGTVDWMSRLNGKWALANNSAGGTFGAVPGNW